MRQRSNLVLSIFEVHFIWCFGAKCPPPPSGMFEPNRSIIFDACLVGFGLWPRMIGSTGSSCMATHRATCHGPPPGGGPQRSGCTLSPPTRRRAPLRMVREEGLAPCYRSYFPVIGVRRPNPMYICFPPNVPITCVQSWMAVLII